MWIYLHNRCKCNIHDSTDNRRSIVRIYAESAGAGELDYNNNCRVGGCVLAMAEEVRKLDIILQRYWYVP
jgi:hypothetical protein